MNLFSYAWDFLGKKAHWSASVVDSGIPARFREQFEYAGLALLIAAAIALPLGLLTGHTNRGGPVVTSIANATRALPTYGVMILLFVVYGAKFGIVLIPLVVLAVPPILLNTYEGVRGVDPELTDAARGMGMRSWQVLWKAEVPAALPLILTGLQAGAVQAVATATLAAVVSFGGLGHYIIFGLATTDYSQVVGGSVLIVAAAILNLLFFALLRRFLVSPGIRKR